MKVAKALMHYEDINEDVTTYFRANFKKFRIAEDDIIHSNKVELYRGENSDIEFGIWKKFNYEVAIKTFRQPDQMKAQIIDEFTLNIYIDNPNVLPIIGYIIYEDTSNISFVTPWMKNGTLADKLSELDPSQKTIIAAKIAEGLGIITSCMTGQSMPKNYCMLCPKNILLDEDMMPKISSLGFIDGSIEARYYTPDYLIRSELDPESINLSSRHAYGNILYEMLNETPIYSGMSEESIIKAINDSNFPKFKKKDKMIERLIKSCWNCNDNSQLKRIYGMFLIHKNYFYGTDFSKIPTLKKEPSTADEIKNELKNQYKELNVDITELELPKKPNKYGGFGKIYFGKYNGKKVAFKLCCRDRNQKETWREIETMITMQNPFSMPLLGYTLGDSFGIIMPLMEGGCLADHMRYVRRDSAVTIENRPLTGTEKTKIAAGIAHSMSRLHDRRKIHMDLKPANILLDVEMWPFLGDYGSVKHPQTQLVAAAQTPVYAPPETVDSPKQFGPYFTTKVDVYSFGVILSEIYMEEPPFDLRTMKDDKMKGIGPKLSSDAPEALRSLIKECTALNTYERPSFTEIFQMFASHQVFFPKTDFGEFDAMLEKAARFEIEDDIEFDQLIKVENKFVRVAGSQQAIDKFVSAASVDDAWNALHSLEDILYRSTVNEESEKFLNVYDTELAIIYDIILRLYQKGERFANLCMEGNMQLYLKFEDESYVNMALKIFEYSAKINPSAFIDNPRMTKRINKAYPSNQRIVISMYSLLFDYISTIPSSKKTKRIVQFFLTLVSSEKPKVDAELFKVVMDILQKLTKDKFQSKIIVALMKIKYSQKEISNILQIAVHFNHTPAFAIAASYLMNHKDMDSKITNMIYLCCQNDTELLDGMILCSVSDHLDVLIDMLNTDASNYILSTDIFDKFPNLPNAVKFALHAMEFNRKALVVAKGFEKKLSEVYENAANPPLDCDVEEVAALGRAAVPLIVELSRAAKTRPEIDVNQMAKHKLITNFCAFAAAHSDDEYLLQEGCSVIANIALSDRITEDMSGSVALIWHLLNSSSDPTFVHSGLVVLNRLLQCEDRNVLSLIVEQVRMTNMIRLLTEMSEKHKKKKKEKKKRVSEFEMEPIEYTIIGDLGINNTSERSEEEEETESKENDDMDYMIDLVLASILTSINM